MSESSEYHVRVYPHALSDHTAQIYAGLHQLADERRITLEFAVAKGDLPRDLEPVFVWMEASRGNATKKVCLDMRDGAYINSPETLAACDIYFKRGYRQSAYADLSAPERAKIRPCGLNYACRHRRDIDVLKRLYTCRINSRRTGGGFGYGDALRYVIRKWLWDRYPERFLYTNIPLLASAFESSPHEPSKAQVTFFTRVWEPPADRTKAERYRALNEGRANVIRALRQRYGMRFLGGLAPTRLALSEYPDCVSPYATDKATYNRLLKESLVAVTTIGLFESNGWKFAEYIAAARCIVAEAPVHELPAPLVEGRHFLAFDSPEGCVEACEKLLSDPEAAFRMQRANADYYRNELQPGVLMWNRLRDCFEHARQPDGARALA